MISCLLCASCHAVDCVREKGRGEGKEGQRLDVYTGWVGSCQGGKKKMRKPNQTAKFYRSSRGVSFRAPLFDVLLMHTVHKPTHNRTRLSFSPRWRIEAQSFGGEGGKMRGVLRSRVTDLWRPPSFAKLYSPHSFENRRFICPGWPMTYYLPAAICVRYQ